MPGLFDINLRTAFICDCHQYATYSWAQELNIAAYVEFGWPGLFVLCPLGPLFLRIGVLCELHIAQKIKNRQQHQSGAYRYKRWVEDILWTRWPLPWRWYRNIRYPHRWILWISSTRASSCVSLISEYMSDTLRKGIKKCL